MGQVDVEVPQGTVSLSLAPQANGTYVPGTELSLEVVAKVAYPIVTWSGVDSYSGRQATLRMTEERQANVHIGETAPGRIVFLSSRDGSENDIFVMAADGSQQARIATENAYDARPAWSPDGTKVAFEFSLYGKASGATDIYVMNADGSNPRRISINSEREISPNWSPGGEKVAFTSYRDAGNPEIYVMTADGYNQTRLTTSRDWDFHPRWAPDGGKILFDLNGGIEVLGTEYTS